MLSADGRGTSQLRKCREGGRGKGRQFAMSLPSAWTLLLLLLSSCQNSAAADKEKGLNHSMLSCFALLLIPPVSLLFLVSCLICLSCPFVCAVFIVFLAFIASLVLFVFICHLSYYQGF